MLANKRTSGSNLGCEWIYLACADKYAKGACVPFNNIYIYAGRAIVPIMYEHSLCWQTSERLRVCWQTSEPVATTWAVNGFI